MSERREAGHVDVPGVRLWVVDEGPLDAPVVLLVGRMAAQAHEWPVALVDALLGAGMRVVRADQRGFGWSGLAAGRPWVIGDFVRDLLGLLDALGVRAPIHVLGASFGGVIARECVLARPGLARTVTFLGSSPGDGKLAVWSEEYRAVAANPPGPSFGERVAYLERELAVMTAGQLHPAAAHGRAVRTVSRGWSLDSLRRTARAANNRTEAERDLDRLRAIRVPVLVVHGTRDAVLAVEHGRLLATCFDDARFLEVEGMGHEPVDAEVAAFAPALVELVTRA